MENNELNALIVRNIFDLEAAQTRAEETIDPLLNMEGWRAMKEALGTKDWFFCDDDDPEEAWFAPRSWIALDADGDQDADPWFRLKAAGGKKYRSWTAHYVSPQSEAEKLSIVWCWHQFYVKDYTAAALSQAKSVDQIVDAGFCRDGRELYLPITFEVDLIAKGLAEGNLKEAFQPVSKAVKAFKEAMPSFETLRAELLSKAK